MNFLKILSRDKKKFYYYYDFGRGPGQRPATGIFTFVKPKNQIEKNHNKEAIALLEVKKSELTLERQALGSAFIPTHKFKANFFEYYQEYVTANKRDGNRHLQNSLTHFRTFIGKDVISPINITENLCLRFRQYLLDEFTGDTPSNYFARFKRVLNAACKDGYFKANPADEVTAKSNPSTRLKENLEADEYIKLLKTPCVNREVQEAFIFCCYTALRYVDVKQLRWEDFKGDMLTTRIVQQKTGKPVVIGLHDIAKAIIQIRRQRNTGTKCNVFKLPTNNGCNKILQGWMKNASIDKHITWHCARLSFSILLQDQNVDAATVALLLGQTSSKYVHQTYKRHRPKDQSKSISHLPVPEVIPSFLSA